MARLVIGTGGLAVAEGPAELVQLIRERTSAALTRASRQPA
jgi:proteasome accessory factor C